MTAREVVDVRFLQWYVIVHTEEKRPAVVRHFYKVRAIEIYLDRGTERASRGIEYERLEGKGWIIEQWSNFEDIAGRVRDECFIVPRAAGILFVSVEDEGF